jgi:transposase-like protein
LAKSRPVIFKWPQSEPEVIVMAVGWYLRFSLSYRDVEELLVERGLDTDHVTVWRWVQRYAPELERRLRAHLKSTNKSWRVDETFVRALSQQAGVMLNKCQPTHIAVTDFRKRSFPNACGCTSISP